jgi:hypothetical protein
MATAINQSIHDLTRAEIARQLGVLVEQRQQIVEQRAELYQRVSKGATGPLLSLDERAARTHAKKLLNGSAPPGLEPPPLSEFNFSSLDQELAAKQRGTDIAIRILSDKEVAAAAAEAVEWAEAHSVRWRQLAREAIVSSAWMDAVKRALAKLLEQCPDITAINFPMANMLGCDGMRVAYPGFSGILDVTSDDLIEAGVKAGIVTKSEIRKVQDI